MPDAQAADLTYVAAPAFVQKASERPPKPAIAAAVSSRVGNAVTSIGGAGYVFVHSRAAPSGGGNWALRQEPIDAVTEQSVEPGPAQPFHPVDAAAEQRVRLLAKKYEASASAEDLARLEILTNRISRLAPRTTGADIERIEDTIDEVADIQLKLDALASEYGV